MLTVTDLLDQLPETEQIALGRAIGGGFHSARRAAACMTDPSTQAQTVGQLLAHLTRAIGELESARDLVQQWA
jgi:hypothetical protein